MTAGKRVRVAGAAVAAGLVLVALGGFIFGERFVFPPVPPPSTPGDGSPRFEIPHPGGVIEVYRARSSDAEPRAFVLRFTGDANQSAKYSASRWRDWPVEAWVVNYPGYGASAGPRTLRHLADASLAAYDALRAAAGGRPIILEGYSLGTVPALHVAANRPVAGLTLQNPPALREVILGHGWWNLWMLAAPVAWSIPGELDSLANAKRCSARAVFLVAEKDETVPADIQRRIYEEYAGEKRLILQRGSKHVEPLREADERLLREGMEWILGR
jgi:hypothetical protein